MNKVIGLTGGIASGKTTVSNYLKKEGFIVLDADEYSKKTTAKNGPAIPQIVEAFGQDILDDEGNLNRGKLGQIIFNDKDQRQVLNNIVHPLIRQMMDSDQDKYLKEGHVFLDIPLLFENGLHKKCDLIITVYVDEAVQLQRLQDRNDLSLEEARARVHSQMPLVEKRNQSDIVFNNNGDLASLYKQIDAFIKDLKSM